MFLLQVPLANDEDIGKYIDASKVEEAMSSPDFRNSEAVFVVTDNHNIPGFTTNMKQSDLASADAVRLIFKGYPSKVKARRYSNNDLKMVNTFFHKVFAIAPATQFFLD